MSFLKEAELTVYLGASLITSMRGMSEPTTPRRIPWDSWRERCQLELERVSLSEMVGAGLVLLSAP